MTDDPIAVHERELVAAARRRVEPRRRFRGKRPRHQLIDILGLLRRPLTKADLSLRCLSDFSKRPFARLGAPDLTWSVSPA